VIDDSSTRIYFSKRIARCIIFAMGLALPRICRALDERRCSPSQVETT